MDPSAVELPERARESRSRAVREPPYRVLVHNDDLTPMDFVIHVLSTVFLIPEINSTVIMYSAHLNGQAYVQTLPRLEAWRRIDRAHFAARLKGFPLSFSMEAE